MKRLVFLLLGIALAAVWTVERLSAARLAREVDALRAQNRDLAPLQREHDLLLSRQPTDAEFAALQRDAAEHARLASEFRTREKTATVTSPALPLGEWTPARAWQNRGQATPRATVETTLWAASGGDVVALKKLLTLDESTLTKAAALLANLTAESRARYATPEDLIAAFTVRNIPIGEAQLVWFKQSTDDDATACVFLQQVPAPGEIAPAAPTARIDSASPASATTREESVRAAMQLKAERAARPNQEPPRAADIQSTKATYLALHREADGWHLVVPPSAIDKIAKELAAPPAP